MDDVYSGTLTLRELAQTIEARQAGDVAPEEYQALLAEIEGLSDEEVRALLAAEETAEGGPGRMRILLTSNTSCDPPKGGSTRANLAWLRHLAATGPRLPGRHADAGGRRDRAGARGGRHCDSQRAASATPPGRAGGRDPRVRAGLGAGVVRGRGPRAAARSRAGRARARGLPGAHAAVLALRAGELESGRGTRRSWCAGRRAMVAIGRHMAGYIERIWGARRR